MLTYKWELSGNNCRITSNSGLSYTIPNRNGVYYLSELLKHPGQEILYSNLVSRGMSCIVDIEFRGHYQFELLQYGLHEEDFYRSIPVTDMSTVNEIAKEYRAVKAKIDIYEEYHDLARVETLNAELLQLKKYLRYACIDAIVPLKRMIPCYLHYWLSMCI